MNITKTDWLAFWKAIDNNDWYIEDSTFPEMEDIDLPDVFSGDGYLMWANPLNKYIGDYVSPYFKRQEIDDSSDVGVKFSTVFKRWQKLQLSSQIIIEVSKDKVDEAIKTLKNLGFKVIN